MEGVLLTIAVLACPVAMGVMMLLMRKDMRRGDQGAHKAGSPSVDDLRAEQRRITAEIERREADERQVDGQLAGR